MKNSLIPRIKNACLQTSSLAVSILIIFSQSSDNVTFNYFDFLAVESFKKSLLVCSDFFLRFLFNFYRYKSTTCFFTLTIFLKCLTTYCVNNTVKMLVSSTIIYVNSVFLAEKTRCCEQHVTYILSFHDAKRIFLTCVGFLDMKVVVSVALVFF